MKCGSDELSTQYKTLVEYLHGENPLKEPLTGWLKLNKQITFDQFSILIQKYKEKGLKIKDKIMIGVNDPNCLKTKKSVYLTLNNWADDKWNKATTK